MLPSELLSVWKRKGTIMPKYARLSSIDNLQVAEELVGVYERSVGKKKITLKRFVGELEDRGFPYRFVRGLAFLLDRRSSFKCQEGVNPADLRRKIFEKTGMFGVPATVEGRQRIMEAVASELKLSQEMVDESFYADLDSELILERFEPISPATLLEEYNLSLTQTLLFDSTELRMKASGNWQRIFYAVKKSGLIYEAYRENGFWVKIDGPGSLFKLTRRYGTAMAKLLPAIIANQDWTVEAKILWKYTNEICDFKIEGWKHGSLLKKPKLLTESFDSFVEEDFASRFRALKSEWQLYREPEPIAVGNQVIIPDFSLERDGFKVYVEIVGFWTEEYLLRKIEKLKKVEAKMLVAVNESLACDRMANLKEHSQLNIIYYKDRIPLAPVVRYLEEVFRNIEVKQTELLRNLPVTFTEPIVDYQEFAARVGVSGEAVKEVLAERIPEGYVLMPSSLVRKDVLEQVRKKIEEHIACTGHLSMSEAVNMIEKNGLTDTSSTLEVLGYRVVWRGINIENAEVLAIEK